MGCEEVRRIIQLYIDSELDSRATLSVVGHLECCAGCSRLLADDLRWDATLKEAARRQPVDSRKLRQEIARAIRKQSTGSRHRFLREMLGSKSGLTLRRNDARRNA